MRATHDSTRHRILDAGESLIAKKGFNGIGLAEILAAAEIPKGSFYHYFGSKEAYGNALLEHYIEGYKLKLDALLNADGLNSATARERLMSYWSDWLNSQSTCSGARKCLVVKLSAEVADLSDDMRNTLKQGTDRVIKRLTTCIEEGIVDQSIQINQPAAVVAQMLYQLWLGASLLSKLSGDRSSFELAMQVTEATLSASHPSS
ncbi:TetR/AcrR family transcriptional regulator [Aquirhabdus parva]|uniref:TetR/AcrR family transcriptional regulator n=1 Tax=Aquirhabdus parva TaxID=2283318 RepID=A0A345P495_9GAMM|nr:TetR/AcrR family transcriptional regulator [Aquirhabdus parva]AXI02104.1 TetR/AcrR family transcriptional regulator [Aquirhabdus parva]